MSAPDPSQIVDPVYQTIVEPEVVQAHLDDPIWLVVDCRYYLANPDQGHKEYLQGHIPGAVYIHLDHDLSSPKIPGKTGRHPLPALEIVAERFGQLGIGDATQVVAYDAAGGALAAGRLWWMLRWLGHTRVAVVNGGWQRWQLENRPVREGEEQRPAAHFSAESHPEMLAILADVESKHLDPDWRLLDARSMERFKGLNETIDPVAGHIPGAVNAPIAENLTAAGLFRPAAELYELYREKLGAVNPNQTILYCGSGVSAAHDLIALELAGLAGGRLFVGSWSEWITDPERPVAK